jgi:diguanylate cyclase (GGDEF)-like protein
VGTGQGSSRHLQRAKALVLVGVLTICAAVWFSADIQRRTAATTAAMQEANTQILLAMLDEETGVRGFVLSGNDAFLRPYLKGRIRFENAVERASSVNGDMPSVAAAHRRQLERAREWHRVAAEAVDLVRRGYQDDASDRALVRKDAIDRFRVANDEAHALIDRGGDAALAQAGRVTIGLILALGAVFGGAGYLLVVRRFRSEERMQAQLTRDAEAQLTFTEDLAVARSEQEVTAVLRRHVGDLLYGTSVAVVQRGTPPRPGAVRLPLLAGSEGEVGHVEMLADEPLTGEQKERVRQCIAQASPALENMRNLARAEHRAATDALTGLPNARALDETLVRLIAHARRGSAPLAAVMLDLDHFKRLNDTCGHDLANDVLAAVARCISESVRASDFAARFGGEEFTLLLPDTDQEGGVVVAEKVRLAIAALEVPGVGRRVTASLGVAAYPVDAVAGRELLRSADRAMYVAKRSGRNRVEAFVGAPTLH